MRAAKFSSSARQKRGNSESCGKKNIYAHLGSFHLNYPEAVLFGRPERTNRRRLELFSDVTVLYVADIYIFCIAVSAVQ